MAAPNYEQIQSFDKVTEQLREAAVDEFVESLYDGISLAEVIEEATRIAEKFALLGAELGAQWYDLCSELAGIDNEPAYVDSPDSERLGARAREAIEQAGEKPFSSAFDIYMQTVINDSIRDTGTANLWRDYERGLAGGRYARVPVGDTCAWCMMLASQGAWYLTEESAGGFDPNHFHDNCNCKVVYHADAESIKGYGELADYKRKYYDADNIRRANSSGREKYLQELKERIASAKAAHIAKLEAGDTDKPWTVYNEDLIIMRYKYGLK